MPMKSRFLLSNATQMEEGKDDRATCLEPFMFGLEPFLISILFVGSISLSYLLSDERHFEVLK